VANSIANRIVWIHSTIGNSPCGGNVNKIPGLSAGNKRTGTNKSALVIVVFVMNLEMKK
jgi:hypothetical protein